MACAVIADTGPLRYLILTGYIDQLPSLFGSVAIPNTVAQELRHASAPEEVRRWITIPPDWLTKHPDPATLGPERLDPGERAAIALAHVLKPKLLLMDDRAAVSAARAQGFRVLGTLALLIEAAARNQVDLASAFAALRATNFRCHRSLLEALLAKHRPFTPPPTPAKP